MNKTIKIRAIVSFICIALLMVTCLCGVFIYDNVSVSKALQGNSCVTDDELDEYYENDEINNDSESGAGMTFSFPGRTLTSEVVPYDGIVRNIACWGDSMTEGIGCSYAVINLDGEELDISYWTYPDALEYFTGLTTFNFGVSGETSEEIAVRAGGIKIYTDRDVVVGFNHGAAVRVVNENGEEEYVQNYGGYGNEYGMYNYGAVYINGEQYYLNGAVYNDEDGAYEIVDLWLTRYNDGTQHVSNTSTEASGTVTNPSGSASGTTETSSSAGADSTAEESSGAESGSVTEASSNAATGSVTDISSGEASGSVTDTSSGASADSVNPSGNASDAATFYGEPATAFTAQEAMERFGVDYFQEFEYDGDSYIIIPAGTLVTPRVAQDTSDSILVIEIGSNGGWQNEYATLVAQIDSIIERFNNPYYIIVGDTDNPGESIDANQGVLDSKGNKIGRNDTYWEAALREAYGDHFLNTREYLITNGLRDVGLLTSKTDLRYFKSGMISEQLRSDWTHFNSYGYYSQAKAIYLKGVELGYW